MRFVGLSHKSYVHITFIDTNGVWSPWENRTFIIAWNFGNNLFGTISKMTVESQCGCYKTTFRTHNGLISIWNPKTAQSDKMHLTSLVVAQENMGGGSTCFWYSHTHCVGVLLSPLASYRICKCIQYKWRGEKNHRIKCKKKERCEILRISMRSQCSHGLE